MPNVVDLDPELVDIEVEPLAVDALPEDNAEDFYEPEASVGDTGDLYGIRMPHAGDTQLGAAEDHDAYEGSDRGENWVEALEEHATAMGPLPEEEVVIVDTSDPEGGHHSTESGNRPVADKGAAGRGGL